MKTRICLFVILFVISIAYISTCRRAGTWLVKKDEPLHADAVVILMGSIPDRILQTVDLYKSGMVDKVFIVEGENDAYRELKVRGADMISGTVQAVNAAVALGIPADSIKILHGNAQSTQQEAVIIREYLINKPNIDTILLVSSANHTRRASLIFKSAFRKLKEPVHVFCSPSPYTSFNAKKWWRDKEDIQVVVLEYIKLVNFLLFEKKATSVEK